MAEEDKQAGKMGDLEAEREKREWHRDEVTGELGGRALQGEEWMGGGAESDPEGQ